MAPHIDVENIIFPAGHICPVFLFCQSLLPGNINVKNRLYDGEAHGNDGKLRDKELSQGCQLHDQVNQKT